MNEAPILVQQSVYAHDSAYYLCREIEVQGVTDPVKKVIGVAKVETRSDAILFSHAHELLEALETLFLQLEAASVQTRREVNYNQIEQVISKARGQS